MTCHRLGRGAKPADVQAAGTELLIYVLRGTLQLEATGAPQRVTAGTVIIIPAHQRLRLQPADTEVALVEFSPERR